LCTAQKAVARGGDEKLIASDKGERTATGAGYRSGCDMRSLIAQIGSLELLLYIRCILRRFGAAPSP
jgi:hypothetical protein